MAPILNLAILNSATLVFPLKLTHTCQDCIPPFAQKWLHSHFPPHNLHKKNIHSFILTQLDDGSHLEFYHVGFRHCHVGFRHLLIFSQIHSKTFSLHYDSWLKLIQSDSNLFILTQLDDGSHLEFGHLEFVHLRFSHLNFFLSNSLTLAKIGSHHLPKKKAFTNSFWPNLMMAAILNSTMLDSDTAILDSDTSLSSLRFTQKHSHSTLTLTQTNSFWLKPIHSHSTYWCSHLEFCHLGFSHLSFSSQTHSHLPRLVPTICTKKKPSLIHSDSTWWWQPSWILPCWIQTPCFLLSDSLKNTLPPFWLLTQTNSIWLKLIHSHSTWWWQPCWILPSWIWPS